MRVDRDIRELLRGFYDVAQHPYVDTRKPHYRAVRPHQNPALMRSKVAKFVLPLRRFPCRACMGIIVRDTWGCHSLAPVLPQPNVELLSFQAPISLSLLFGSFWKVGVPFWESLIKIYVMAFLGSMLWSSYFGKLPF